MITKKVFAKKSGRIFPREMVRIRTSGNLNPTASRSGQTITTVPARKVLVIETISANIRIPKATPMPEVARFVVVTGSAFPSGTGSPLLGWRRILQGILSIMSPWQASEPMQQTE
jgi:archaeosine-15-forming tRNA-guanine transglycosylase